MSLERSIKCQRIADAEFSGNLERRWSPLLSCSGPSTCTATCDRGAGREISFSTALSFLNVTKYPPSLLFLLMTLGIGIAVLAWFEMAGRGPLSRALITFGRVPLFFYFGQWVTAHGLAVLACYVAGQPLAWQFATPLERPSPNPGNLGFSLWVVYLLWILGTLLLYPLCRWFADVKRRRSDWWLSYL